jgi:glycosyltransferase involved in cell wall biosynthesis
MAKRRKIGIVFFNDSNWIGGTYYILNLIQALQGLEEEQKPELIIFSFHKKDIEPIIQTGYPYFSFLPLNIPYSIPERIVNKFSMVLLSKQFIVHSYPSHTADIVFPSVDHEAITKIPRHLFWIPDFQEHYLPDFFPKNILEERRNKHKKISKKDYIVFSSKDAENDFKKIYPESKASTSVLNFAVTHPEFKHLDIEILLDKYHLKKTYFFSPNQFWSHKNHVVLIKAAILLKKEGKEFQIVFSGKENDERNPDYFPGLKKIIAEEDLTQQIKFLGFIPRDEQLQIMNHSLAVVQPSLFEGWSTVVEDAKAMNKFILASNIKVHQEQLDNNVMFFNPSNAEELSEKMKEILNKKPQAEFLDYKTRVRDFGKGFINIVNKIIN